MPSLGKKLQQSWEDQQRLLTVQLQSQQMKLIAKGDWIALEELLELMLLLVALQCWEISMHNGFLEKSSFEVLLCRCSADRKTWKISTRANGKQMLTLANFQKSGVPLCHSECCLESQVMMLCHKEKEHENWSMFVKLWCPVAVVELDWLAMDVEGSHLAMMPDWTTGHCQCICWLMVQVSFLCLKASAGKLLP